MTWRQNHFGPEDQIVLVVSLFAAPSLWIKGRLEPVKFKSWYEMSADFQELLFVISEALVTDELAALKFLSLEYIPMKKLEAIQETKAFLEVLQEKDLIEEGNLFFLKELFYLINRIDLLSGQLGSSREEMERELQIPGRAKVSEYRKLLYGIAENMHPDDVKSMKFLLQEEIPKSKLQDDASMLKVFLEMERNGIIKDGDLKVLKDKLKRLRADLKKRIVAYEEKQKENKSKEELCSPVPVSGHPSVQGAERQTLHLETYKMEHIPRGYCLILNNYKFKNPWDNREGTLKDGEAVKRVFQWLQFVTVEHMNLEAEQMYAKVKEYSKKDHTNMDCFVCFIFSHGIKDKISGVDGEFVNVKDLVSCFRGSNCLSLAGKPKLFFIQACQGSGSHPAVKVVGDFPEHLETDTLPFSIPDLADILVGMATVEDYECYRSGETGSVYIQCLCEKMELLCPLRKDLMTILTEVNKEVGQKELNGWKQMPKISSTLRKQLIFKL
ncbi:caspase-8 isoform X1 [Calypte anna]|uniref:caspase-8 isoform X1 n=2 Tax=Calypte anna TaxID=9244 RepID=UPI0011C3F5ED|nr:caspase-8 isoform X1 [Calypte anna]